MRQAVAWKNVWWIFTRYQVSFCVVVFLRFLLNIFAGCLILSCHTIPLVMVMLYRKYPAQRKTGQCYVRNLECHQLKLCNFLA